MNPTTHRNAMLDRPWTRRRSHPGRLLRAVATMALAIVAAAAATSRPALAGGHDGAHVAGSGIGDGGGGGGGDSGTGAGSGGHRGSFDGPGFGTNGGVGAGRAIRGAYWFPPTSSHSWSSGFPTCPPPIAPPATWQRFFLLYTQYLQTVDKHLLPFAAWLAGYVPVDGRDYTAMMQMYAWYARYAAAPSRGHMTP